MFITESEYRQYMNLLESQIKDYKERCNNLYNTLDNWNDPFNPTSEKSWLTQEEIKDLIQSFTASQHDLFRQWYKLNNQLREQGLAHYNSNKHRDIGNYLVGVVRYTEVITSQIAK